MHRHMQKPEVVAGSLNSFIFFNKRIESNAETGKPKLIKIKGTLHRIQPRVRSIFI